MLKINDNLLGYILIIVYQLLYIAIVPMAALGGPGAMPFFQSPEKC